MTARRRVSLLRPSHLTLMLALTFSTGVIDAVGFLGLDRVFTGNMTGNVVILGMALVGADGLPVTGPLLALGAFMLGAAATGRVLRSAPEGWTTRTTSLLTVVAVLLALTTILAFVIPEPGGAVALGITASLGAAMGVQAATARHIAVKDVTTVVVTSTITGLAADSWLGARTGQPWVRRALAIALILVGASVGALALQLGLAAGIGVSAALTIAVALGGHVTRTRRSD